MLQVRRATDFFEKALGADRCGELRFENLERNGAVVLDVVRQIDRGHAAGAELAVNAVVRGQCRLQVGEKGSHVSGESRVDAAPMPCLPDLECVGVGAPTVSAHVVSTFHNRRMGNKLL
jgi:hypothetical protein